MPHRKGKKMTLSAPCPQVLPRAIIPPHRVKFPPGEPVYPQERLFEKMPIKC